MTAALPTPANDPFTAGLETLTRSGPIVPEIEAESLVVDLDGFEGPLDVLLVLARSQKVDLRKLSILQLADQYLSFVMAARRLRLELAADYLVMAAWLTYMKSRLLLPEPPANDDEPSGEEMAARLAFQLQRLEAMRECAVRLLARARLGRDVFARGMPEGVRIIRTPRYEASLFDLLKAYGEQRIKTVEVRYEVRRREVFSIEEARARLESMLGALPNWSRLEAILMTFAPVFALPGGDDHAVAKRRSMLASALSATLELVKEGHAEVRQAGLFEPIYIRAKAAAPAAPATVEG